MFAAARESLQGRLSASCGHSPVPRERPLNADTGHHASLGVHAVQGAARAAAEKILTGACVAVSSRSRTQTKPLRGLPSGGMCVASDQRRLRTAFGSPGPY